MYPAGKKYKHQKVTIHSQFYPFLSNIFLYSPKIYKKIKFSDVFWGIKMSFGNKWVYNLLSWLSQHNYFEELMWPNLPTGALISVRWNLNSIFRIIHSAGPITTLQQLYKLDKLKFLLAYFCVFHLNLSYDRFLS